MESILKYKGIYKEQDRAWVIDYDKHGAKLGTATVRRRNGSTTYLLRDIATVFDRFKTHSFDKMLYVVCEQDVHLRQVFKAVELMGHTDIAGKLQHITFAKAGGPSSHLGNAQLLSDILDQCEKHMHEAVGSNPDQFMGINSLVVQELSSKKGHSSGLDFGLMTSLEGETGPNCNFVTQGSAQQLRASGHTRRPRKFPASTTPRSGKHRGVSYSD